MATAEVFPLRRAIPAIGIGAIAASAIVLLPVAGASAVTLALCLLPLAWYVFSVPCRWLVMFFAGYAVFRLLASDRQSASTD